MKKVHESQKQNKVTNPKICIVNSKTSLDQLETENKMLLGIGSTSLYASRISSPVIIKNNNFIIKSHCELGGNRKDINENINMSKNISDMSTENQTFSSRSIDKKIDLKLNFNQGIVFSETFEKIIKFN